jgi:glycosyltransferase involved in cell wall biosynthesis
MRILLISDTHLSKELGASKVVMELADELTSIGWDCHLSSLPELIQKGYVSSDRGSADLRSYLREHASAYDVVDYGHSHLPYLRSEFPATTLFVARSVLLVHHFDDISIPNYPTWKARVYSLIFNLRNRVRFKKTLARTNITVAQADLVNVPNDDDRDTLIRHGISGNKIVVLPYGLSQARWSIFDSMSTALPPAPMVAFVGTFDGRKGAADFPKIVRLIAKKNPGVRFRLLGTYKSSEEVLARFPNSLRPRIEVIAKYASDDLPNLLASCSVGIFPSYIEGFGFGVLEMLAAGLPVIAYNVPGPPMMLTERYLVNRGDTLAMSNRVTDLLKSDSDLIAARAWAKKVTKQFLWSNIARETSDVYLENWKLRIRR